MICTMTDSATLKTNLIVAKLQINSNVVYDERENRPLRVENGEQQTTKVKNCWKIMVTWLFYRSCLPLTCCVISLLVPLATSQESFWWNALAHTWQEYHGNHMLFTFSPPKKRRKGKSKVHRGMMSLHLQATFIFVLSHNNHEKVQSCAKKFCIWCRTKINLNLWFSFETFRSLGREKSFR